LDYVILLAQSDPSEAKRIFNQVKNRTQSDSPVYSRVQQLAKTYE
jgi:predicted Zn-ribbon and HTH transcriptional regulator